MRSVTDKDVREIIKRAFGRHGSPERFAKSLPLKDVAKKLIQVWEARYPFPHYN